VFANKKESASWSKLTIDEVMMIDWRNDSAWCLFCQGLLSSPPLLGDQSKLKDLLIRPVGHLLLQRRRRILSTDSENHHDESFMNVIDWRNHF